MRFLVDVHHIGGRQTGNETWARNIAAALARRAGGDELVFAAAQEGLSEVASLTGLRPEAVSSSSGRRLLVDLPRLAHRERVDALLVQYTMPMSAAPAVVMVHDVSFLQPEARAWMPTAMRNRLRVALSAAVYRRAILLAPSEFTRSELLRLTRAQQERVRLAPNAVDPNLAALLRTKVRTRSDNSFRVLAVGNVLPRKNVITIAQAVGELRRLGADATLRLVGAAPHTAQGPSPIQSLQGHAERLEWTGYVSDEQLAQEYADADVVAFPSLYEGFGIPVLEAMAAGAPVVVSDRGSLPEVAGDAAIVVPALDVAAWVKAFESVRDNTSLREELTVRGRRRSQDYSWEDSADTVWRALRDAAGQQAHRGRG